MVLTSLLMSCLLNFNNYILFKSGAGFVPPPKKKTQTSVRESFQTTHPEQINLPSLVWTEAWQCFTTEWWFSSDEKQNKTNQQTNKTLCLFQLPTRTCVTRAERTKLHLQVLCVRLNVKQIQTWRKKSHKKQKQNKNKTKHKIRSECGDPGGEKMMSAKQLSLSAASSPLQGFGNKKKVKTPRNAHTTGKKHSGNISEWNEWKASEPTFIRKEATKTKN